MRYSITNAASQVARLQRHNRVPTEAEVLDAYRELAAAKVEQCIGSLDTRGLPLDPERSEYLLGLLSGVTVSS